jgi:hypothetical protein
MFIATENILSSLIFHLHTYNQQQISYLNFTSGNENLLKPIEDVEMSVGENHTITVEATDLAGHVDIITNSSTNSTK